MFKNAKSRHIKKQEVLRNVKIYVGILETPILPEAHDGTYGVLDLEAHSRRSDRYMFL